MRKQNTKTKEKENIMLHFLFKMAASTLLWDKNDSLQSEYIWFNSITGTAA